MNSRGTKGFNLNNMKKKCARCEIWKPLDREHFPLSRTDKDSGKMIWKSMCKPCYRLKYRENASNWKTITTKNMSEQARIKRRITQQARADARIKLAQKYRREFEILYAEELQKRGVTLQYYRGIGSGKKWNDET